MTNNPHDLLPLTPAVFHVLLALTDGRSHGYAIAQEVESRTDGKVRMGPGTLYGSLQRMCAAGLIQESRRGNEEAGPGDRRRYYTMTPFGRKVLRAETRRLSGVVNYASAKVGLGKSGAGR
jgi:DNA-binding PadR family transcriptional regulator